MIVIDRIEDGKIVCESESGQMILDLSELPGAGEGDVIFFADGHWQKDEDSTAARRERIRRRTARRLRRPKEL